MTNQTYYDSMLNPIIREAKGATYLPRMKVQSSESGLESKWFDVSENQLEKILHILNTEI